MFICTGEFSVKVKSTNNGWFLKGEFGFYVLIRDLKIIVIFSDIIHISFDPHPPQAKSDMLKISDI